MKPCANCGVEVEENANFCPLCGEPVVDKHTGNIDYITIRKRKKEEKALTDYQKLSSLQKRKLFWEISGIVLITGILVTLLIDLFASSRITWSRYSVTVCAVLFLNTTLIRFWPKNLMVLMLGSMTSTSALLILLDVFTGNMDWGVNLGVPLLVVAHILTLALTKIIKRAREKGLNIIAYSFIALGIFSLGIEGVVSLYVKNAINLHWSLVVIASVLPGAAILFFIHYRLKRGTDLRRFFHI
ncbi:MAG: DUF6320 domain-containing protein [Bacteroidales bacterium]|nr:DUF6320 domain-containing protein [Bacteroidales bacterium]MCF8333395.1 DUF6320 domain-containing protein [Bacteroidales bacterium]